MNKLFKHPPLWLLLIAYALTLIFSTVSIVFVSIGKMDAFAYPFFALSALLLGYSIYTVVRFRLEIKKGALKILYSNKFTKRYLESFGFRALVGSSISFFISVLFGIFNGVLGIMGKSVWYGALSFYYIITALIYGSLLLNLKSTSYKIYKRCGYFMAILNTALSAFIAQMIFEDKGFVYGDIMIYVFASYAFYKLTMAIIRLFKTRHHKSPVLSAIALINLTSGMVSVLALQTALLSTFGDGIDNSLFNTLTGSAVSLTAIGISIFMIINGSKKLKLEKTNE